MLTVLGFWAVGLVVLIAILIGYVIIEGLLSLVIGGENASRLTTVLFIVYWLTWGAYTLGKSVLLQGHL